MRSFAGQRVRRLIADGFTERQKERELKREKWKEYYRLYAWLENKSEEERANKSKTKGATA
jgi:hypothetical protein